MITIRLLLFLCCLSPAAPARQRIVTAAQVNGTWETKTNTLKVWALGGGKLKVKFYGIYQYRWADGTPLANTGEGSGVADIYGDTATFKPEDAEDGCLITLHFVRGRLEVTQTGVCGFGHNVTAEGRYRRTSKRRPDFSER